MIELRQLFAQICESFRLKRFSDPAREAEDLLCELLELPRFQLYFNANRLLTEQERGAALNWTKRRLMGEPLAYLSQKISFYHCVFEVNPSVLIPRPETEILVDKIVSTLKGEDLCGKVFWDICCGSGCIGIAVKKALSALLVCLSDCSKDALQIARKNAERNLVDVECVEGDFLTPFQGRRAHFLACNPPYLTENEYENLDLQVKGYEPRISLVAGKTGLEYYERLAAQLPDFLHPGGRVWLEMGHTQGPAVENLFKEPIWKKCVLENDWAGHNRFLYLESER